MINDPHPRKRREPEEDPTFTSQPDRTPRREGGGDSLAESRPDDPRSDEKVIVNTPPQSAPYTEESEENQIINQ